MSQPTVEDVERIRHEGEIWFDWDERKIFCAICDAYLAQGKAAEEQKDAVLTERLAFKQQYWDQRELIDKLEVENQALKAENALLQTQHVDSPLTLRHIAHIEAENQALKARVTTIVEAIRDEPELPGPMPEDITLMINDVGIEEAMRIVVRETKKGILRRIEP